MAFSAYHHLTYENRCQIAAFKESGLSIRKIAIRISKDFSTVCRELKRNAISGVYEHNSAEQNAKSLRKKASSTPRKMKDKTLTTVTKMLTESQWSPQQIAGWMHNNMKNSITHEAIYQYVWKDKRQGGILYKNLRHQGKKYNKRKGTNAGRGLIPNRVDIDQRPAIVDQKIRIGDWELDTIIGKDHQGAIVSMVDRATKYTKLALVECKTAQLVTDAILEKLEPWKDVVLTLTADNGKEFAMHETIASGLSATVYFAKPYHSWQRGLNEHTNGLVRQYFPKGSCFKKISKEDVQKVEILLNLRPRKSLNFRTPLEAFKKAQFDTSTVALQS